MRVHARACVCARVCECISCVLTNESGMLFHLLAQLMPQTDVPRRYSRDGLTAFKDWFQSKPLTVYVAGIARPHPPTH